MKKYAFSVLWPSFLLPLLSLIIGLLLWNDLPEVLLFDLPKDLIVIGLPLASVVLSLLVAWRASTDIGFYLLAGQRQILRRLLISLSILLFGLNQSLLQATLWPDQNLLPLILFGTLGLFLFSMGMSIRGLEPNSAIGFRFPWNKKNRRAWERTHDLFYRWFVLTGLLFLVLLPFYAIPPVALGLLVIALSLPTCLSWRYARALQAERSEARLTE